jgi:glycerophosphoryl diester phosphodiesterase
MKHRTKLAAFAALIAIALGAAVGDAHATLNKTVGQGQVPKLVGRAVLPVETLAPGPPAGANVADANGIDFPLASQPVEGFSAIVEGREPGEFLAMPDNGFGNKANSFDFLIRAYYIRPDFKTAKGGSGTVDVREFISFRDPNHLIGFPIVNEATTDRLLTGADIDPESLQRGRHGDLWVGEEFGPWILHFSADGELLDPPFPIPGVIAATNPFIGTQTPTIGNSRGFEGIAISPSGRYLYGILEGAVVGDAPDARRVYEFDTRTEALTGRTWRYRTEQPAYMVADVQALDNHRLALIERDGTRGAAVVFRGVYVVDLHRVDAAEFVRKDQVLDLTNIPDPNLVSLPEIHDGDVRLGDPFAVVCESVEALRLLTNGRMLVGCDNNLPNTGRNPNRADDNEFIVVKVPGIPGH